tara:strand:- start:86 stop:274 length:189 start_codon:yes stop_codon:yes gene_type:complete
MYKNYRRVVMKEIVMRQMMYFQVPEENDANWYMRQLQDMGDGELLLQSDGAVERFDWEIQEV